MKANKKFVWIIVITILIIICIGYRTANKPRVYESAENKKLNTLFQGTFTTEGSDFSYITVDGEKREFYYFGDMEKLYFSGIFSNVGEGYYQLNSDAMGSQIIRYEDMCFNINIEGKVYTFEKISNNEMYGKFPEEE